jgi:hypothetical protein
MSSPVQRYLACPWLILLVAATCAVALVNTASGTDSLLTQASGDTDSGGWGGDWEDLSVSPSDEPPSEPASVPPTPGRPSPAAIAQEAASPAQPAADKPAEAGWDWSDWGDPTSTSEEPAAAAAIEGTPAGPAAAAGPAGTGTGADSWDWDWGETPAPGAVTATRRAGTGAKTTSPGRRGRAVKPREQRLASTAEPDFEGEIRTGYRLFAGVQPFQVIPSKKDPEMHPCLDCHDWAESDKTPRELQEPHDNFRLKHGLHGKGEFWCFTCHHLEGEGGLRTLEGLKVPFDEAYIVCSQCHAQETRDWYFGAHGKRVTNWRGDRQILNCTACHYQHKPALTAREAIAGPTMRMGMERPDHWAPKAQHHTQADHKPLWERIAERRSGGQP